jgi:hypothetical protein
MAERSTGGTGSGGVRASRRGQVTTPQKKRVEYFGNANDVKRGTRSGQVVNAPKKSSARKKS